MEGLCVIIWEPGILTVSVLLCLRLTAEMLVGHVMVRDLYPPRHTLAHTHTLAHIIHDLATAAANHRTPHHVIPVRICAESVLGQPEDHRGGTG